MAHRDGGKQCPPAQVGSEGLGHSGIQTARIIGTCQASVRLTERLGFFIKDRLGLRFAAIDGRLFDVYLLILRDYDI